MPKISVNPRASNAYCAPRLIPINPDSTKPSKLCSLLAGCSFYFLDRQFLAVDDHADAERQGKLLVDAEELFSYPLPLAEIGIVDRQRAQRFRDLLGIADGAGLGDGFHYHARRADPLIEQVVLGCFGFEQFRSEEHTSELQSLRHL